MKTKCVKRRGKIHHGNCDYSDENSTEYWQEAKPNEKWKNFLEESRVKSGLSDEMFESVNKNSDVVRLSVYNLYNSV